MDREAQHVFMVGARGLGGYGGFETFVNKLTEYHQDNEKIRYHVACKANGPGSMDISKLDGVDILSDSEFIYHNAHCVKFSLPNIGAAQAFFYDSKALKYCINYIKENHILHPIIYIMACRIGPIIHRYYKKIHNLGGYVYLNPDGHEWMRSKWNALIRRYWKMSERRMVKNSDLVVCDSKNIESYIHEMYDGKGFHRDNPLTTYIAYGAEMRRSRLQDNDPKLLKWYEERSLTPKNYYLIVGRFVPENNYETMIKEYMASNTKRDLAIITGTNEKLLEELEKKFHFSEDNRIKFVGSVYDQELLMKIRENAYGYIHGHEVGGTNPSLLEALACTDLNLLLDVGFNREVAESAALYWNKTPGNLANLIGTAEAMSGDEIFEYGNKAKSRIREAYNWPYIASKCEEIFLG